MNFAWHNHVGRYVPPAIGAVAGALVWALFVFSMNKLGFGDGTYGADSGTTALLFLYLPLRELVRAFLVSEAVRTARVGMRTSMALETAAGYSLGEIALFVFSHGLAPVWLFRGLLEAAASLSFTCLVLLSGASRGRSGGLTRLASWALVAALLRVPLSYLALGRGVAISAAAVPLLIVLALGTWWFTEHGAQDVEATSLRVGVRPRTLTLPGIRREVEKRRAAVRGKWVLFGIPVYAGALVGGFAIGVLFARQLGFDLALVDEGAVRSIGPVIWLLCAVMAFYLVAGFLHAAAARAKNALEAAVACALSFVLVWALVGVSGITAVMLCVVLSPLAIGFASVGAWGGAKLVR